MDLTQVNLSSGTDVNSVNDAITYAMSPGLLGIAAFVILIYYYIFYSIGVSTPVKPAPKTAAGMIIELILWSLFIFLGVINTIQYYYDIDIKTEIKNFFSEKPELAIEVKQLVEEEKPTSNIAIQPQVFHLKDNRYTYENAKAVCKAYGAKLATMDNIQESHKKGGEWCSYGWSDGQMALFPTQKESWEKLQKIEGHKHDCGRPGINGGYIANPNIKFGVNCYGYKPKINKQSKYLMDNNPVYPKSAKEIEFDKRVSKWRKEIKNLVVAPFNGDRWSVI